MHFVRVFSRFWRFRTKKWCPNVAPVRPWSTPSHFWQTMLIKKQFFPFFFRFCFCRSHATLVDSQALLEKVKRQKHVFLLLFRVLKCVSQPAWVDCEQLKFVFILFFFFFWRFVVAANCSPSRPWSTPIDIWVLFWQKLLQKFTRKKMPRILDSNSRRDIFAVFFGRFRVSPDTPKHRELSAQIQLLDTWKVLFLTFARTRTRKNVENSRLKSTLLKNVFKLWFCFCNFCVKSNTPKPREFSAQIHFRVACTLFILYFGFSSSAAHPF